MPKLSRRAMSLQESAIRKLDPIIAATSDVHFHRLNIGQPDVPTPAAVLDAIQSFRPKVLAYGPSSGTPACRRAAAAYHGRWSPGLGPEHVSVTVGGSEALLFALCALGDPGDEVIVPEPYYTNYNGFATVAGMRVRPVRTRLADGFALPSDEVLDAACTDRTRAILFSNPGNPTGAVYGREALERLARWAKRRGIFMISDEVYRRIWFDKAPTSALELEGMEDHVIVVDSMSKTYSACGLRLGFLISRNTELMARVDRLGQARLGAQPMAQAAAIAGLTLPESYYEDLRARYKARVYALNAGVAALPGVQTFLPTGAFYAMAALPVDDSEAFCRWLVTDFREAGESLVLAPGPGFYADPSDGRTLVRMAAVLEPSKLKRAVELLRLGLERYPGRTPTA
jgi:aspartate aminotransferase